MSLNLAWHFVSGLFMSESSKYQPVPSLITLRAEGERSNILFKIIYCG